MVSLVGARGGTPSGGAPPSNRVGGRLPPPPFQQSQQPQLWQQPEPPITVAATMIRQYLPIAHPQTRPYPQEFRGSIRLPWPISARIMEEQVRQGVSPVQGGIRHGDCVRLPSLQRVLPAQGGVRGAKGDLQESRLPPADHHSHAIVSCRGGSRGTIRTGR